MVLSILYAVANILMPNEHLSDREKAACLIHFHIFLTFFDWFMTAHKVFCHEFDSPQIIGRYFKVSKFTYG